ncbi:MAG: hydroxyacid dehydrogenase [Candidatus Latescibacteria bacterium]|jgi:phosphoglycerate dehydrogenase-like enzyme|nr:hydroxyacid dehydrogenase [Candidatus Latescibacterota bacterium]
MPQPKVLLAFNKRVREGYIPPEELERLETFATYKWFECEGGGIYNAHNDPDTVARLAEQVGDADAIIVCHGCPTLGPTIFDHAPKLKFIGELEGDRFAARIDLEAAWERNIRTVDTTQGSSYPVAEWALALILISLRNAGAAFRRIIASDTPSAEKRNMRGVLTGKRVGLIGCGHMGRRLISFLQPFNTDIWVYDPYLSRDIAEIVGFTQTSLDNILSKCDVIVCVAPLTPGTKGMIGKRELDLIRPGSAFVNVSRGAIVDSNALIERLKKGDITAGIEAFDPEPIPTDSEIIHLPNVFLSPHFGGITGDDYPHFFNLMVDELHRFFQGHETYFDLTPQSLANRKGD